MSQSFNTNANLNQAIHHGVEPLVAEDILLLLFQPASRTIAGENTLFYVLGGAILTDLALTGHVTFEGTNHWSSRVQITEKLPPTDAILRSSWEYISEKPRNPQTLLAAIGPTLRGQLLDRLVQRGDLMRSEGKFLGIFNTTTLDEGTNGRRADLIVQVRAVLVDRETPTPGIGAAIAFLVASRTLPSFYKEIPWTSQVIARATEVGNGQWGADAAADAVTRTINAVITNSMIAANVLPRG